jgi:CRISPR-associated protein Cas6/Cse3/CasE subtype I-E
MSDQVSWLTRGLITHRTLFARGIKDAYTWHQLVWQAFPGRDGAPRDFLTRLDDKSSGVQLLIVSPTTPIRPDWLGGGDEWESKRIPATYFSARRYRFQLRANPTYKALNDKNGNYISDPRNRKRRAITGETELTAWLQRKGEAGGFRLVAQAPLEIRRDVQAFEKRSAEGAQMRGLHNAVDFSGILEVTDPTRFLEQTFAKGLGSAKAFGFGLLVITPC